MQPADEDQASRALLFRHLNAALHQVGMLKTRADASRRYLREHQERDSLRTLVRIDPGFMRNMAMCMRPVAPYVRYKPYTIRERHRTKSENNEEKEASLVGAVVDEVVENSVDLAQLKKAKSLESIIAESEAEVDVQNANITEVEVVSNSIRNLKVAE